MWPENTVLSKDFAGCEPGSFSSVLYVVGSKIFRRDIQKPRQMENAVRGI